MSKTALTRMIRHAMMPFDHGAPPAGFSVSTEKRPDADVNIAFHVKSKFAGDADTLA
jgi:hypothetical protein